VVNAAAAIFRIIDRDQAGHFVEAGPGCRQHLSIFGFNCREDTLIQSKDVMSLEMPGSSGVTDVRYVLQHGFHVSINDVRFFGDSDLAFLTKADAMKMLLSTSLMLTTGLLVGKVSPAALHSDLPSTRS
jgi:hypothetical protein